MVVLAASLCTASGKVLISRQFVDVPRTRIEGLLSAFPKLTDVGSQHTTIETENIRYVYQPMDHLFLILITNRQSNILQDLDTLRLLGRVVTEICHSTDESRVLENSFELLSAFDEVIQFGYRDSVTLSQIKTIIEMESHEERIQDIIAKNKEKEAKDRMKEKAREFEEARKRAARSGGSGGIGSTYKSGFASIPPSEPKFSTANEPVYDKPKSSVPTNALGSGVGMKLGAKKKTTDFMNSLMEETGTLETTSPTLDQEVEELPEEDQEGVHLQFRENISCQVSRDGGVETLDLKGELTLKVNNGNQSKLRVPLSYEPSFGYQFKTHPNIDKQKFNEESVLQLKDLSREFPVGTGLGVLKWRVNSKQDKLVPFSVNCWPNVVDDHCEVNLEVELENKELELNNVIIEIPIPHDSEPNVGEIEGNYEVDYENSVLVWEIPLLDGSNPNANLEFKAPTDDADTFFPIQIGFECHQPYSGIKISEVFDAQTNESYTFSNHSALTVEEFSIV